MHFIFRKYKHWACLKPIGTYVHTYVRTYVPTYIYTCTRCTLIRTYIDLLHRHTYTYKWEDRFITDENELIFRNPVPGGHFCFIVKFPKACFKFNCLSFWCYIYTIKKVERKIHQSRNLRFCEIENNS